MTKIKQLSVQEAQKIAAGEVVERPANVVKELIENALDAQATEIALYLQEGGKELIRIVDNGCGMSPEDARLCIKNHATSKISSVDDLTQLSTFGFRGEALASIAAVSEMTIITKEESALAGALLEIKEGTIVKEVDHGAITGTDIAVAHLFFNVPARQKFLKSKETEWRAIVQLFQAFALAYPEVTFKLFHDNRMVHHVPKTTELTTRIGQLFELHLQKNLVQKSMITERMNISLTVACTTTEYVRFDRNQLFAFVNKRWVKNHKLAQALIKGYRNSLANARYPAGFIFIEIDPAFVDINIHPRKEEVQFLHPRIIEELIEQTTYEALETKHTQSLKPAQSTELKPKDAPPSLTRPSLELPKNIFPLSASAPQQAPINEKFLQAITQSAVPEPPIKQEHIAPSLIDYRLLGQYKLTYILIETEPSLVFIDQHAAHERVMYELLKNSFNAVEKVRLLFPQLVKLTAQDLELFEPYIEMLASFGIEAQRVSPTDLAIIETPIFLKNQSLEDSIKKAVSILHEYDYLDGAELKKIMIEQVHAQLSCKAAIKAGDTLTQETMHELIKKLYGSVSKLTCPHGRPTLWELPLTDIEKKFKRDYR